MNEIIVGNEYRCIKEVVMNGGCIAYYEGKVYPSAVCGAITDEQGDDYHNWSHRGQEEHFELVDTREMTECVAECVVCDETKLVHDVCIDCITRQGNDLIKAAQRILELYETPPVTTEALSWSTQITKAYDDLKKALNNGH